MTSTSLVSLIALIPTSFAMTEGPKSVRVEGYVPAHLPPFLAKLKPEEVNAPPYSMRGCREIHFVWSVELPDNAVVEILEQHYSMEPMLGTSTGGRSLYKVLRDRSIHYITQPGRLGRTLNTASFTEVRLIERARPTGPLPGNWPKVAKTAVSLPRDAPRLPFSDVTGPPAGIDFQNEPGRVVWNLHWYVKESHATALPKWIASLKRKGGWEIAPQTSGVACYGKQGGRTVEIWISNVSAGDLPSGWSKITMSWRGAPNRRPVVRAAGYQGSG